IILHTFKFDAPYTLFSLNTAIRNAVSPHTDFRLALKANRDEKQNKPFSARSLSNNGTGFNFAKEIGTPIHVFADEMLDQTFYNDTVSTIYPGLIFTAKRGHIKEFRGKQILTELEFDNGVKRGLQLIPVVQVIEPTAAVSASGSKTAEYISDDEFTILKIMTAARAVAAGSSHKDFRCDFELKGGQLQQVRGSSFSAKSLSKDNGGFDFINEFGAPLELGTEDSIYTTFRNDDPSNTLHPSIILIGFRGFLTEKGMNDLITARKGF
ncbi:MAG: hypothetical protein K8S87_11385, partial [Planctomycetes bacterium]|nr:hypothetical protein [Planctomycetota bacterium]